MWDGPEPEVQEHPYLEWPGCGCQQRFHVSLSLSLKDTSVYLFMAVLGLCCCPGAPPQPRRGGFSLPGFLCCGAGAAGRAGFRGCRSRAPGRRLGTVAHGQLLHSTWDLPGPGIEPMSVVLAGGFFIYTQGKPLSLFLSVVKIKILGGSTLWWSLFTSNSFSQGKKMSPPNTHAIFPRGRQRFRISILPRLRTNGESSLPEKKIEWAGKEWSGPKNIAFFFFL